MRISARRQNYIHAPDPATTSGGLDIQELQAQNLSAHPGAEHFVPEFLPEMNFKRMVFKALAPFPARAEPVLSGRSVAPSATQKFGYFARGENFSPKFADPAERSKTYLLFRAVAAKGPKICGFRKSVQNALAESELDGSKFCAQSPWIVALPL